MQKLVSQIPQLSELLSRLPRSQHQQTVRHLIKLGLDVSRSYCCKENQTYSEVRKELDRIHNSIDYLNQIVQQQRHQFSHYHQGCSQPTQSQKNNSSSKNKYESHDDKPVKDTDLPAAGVNTRDQRNIVSLNPFSKKKGVVSRHHLDDTAARQALEFPPQTLRQGGVQLKRRSQQFKKHIYQDEINKDEIVRLKEQRGESLDRIKRDRTVSDYSKATSKIKPLIEKDRIRFNQRRQEYQFQEGYNKYQYSDESQMSETSKKDSSRVDPLQAYPQAPEQPIYPHYAQPQHQLYAEQHSYSQNGQSSFKGSNAASSSQKSRPNKTSSKKEVERRQASSKLEGSLQIRSKESSSQQNWMVRQEGSSEGGVRQIEYEGEDDDVISNSSSFSQFSISGSRKEVGKISRRSNKE